MKNTALGLGLALSIALVGLPGTANASLVQCYDEFGECEVTNEGIDSVSCTCGSGDTATGGEEWADFGDRALMEICLSYLALCGEETDGTLDGTGGTTEDPGCDSDGEGTAAESGEGSEMATSGEEGTGGDTATSGEEGTGEGGAEAATEGGSESEGVGLDGGDMGWGCSVAEGSGLGTIASLGLLGLLGLRRRRARV